MNTRDIEIEGHDGHQRERAFDERLALLSTPSAGSMNAVEKLGCRDRGHGKLLVGAGAQQLVEIEETSLRSNENTRVDYRRRRHGLFGIGGWFLVSDSTRPRYSSST